MDQENQNSEDGKKDSRSIKADDHGLESKRKELKSLELRLLEKEIDGERRKLEEKIREHRQKLAEPSVKDDESREVMIQQWLSKLEVLEGQIKEEINMEERKKVSTSEEGEGLKEESPHAKSKMQILLDLVNEKRTVGLNQAATQLGWKKQSIETYSTILENRGYIGVRRRLLREPILFLKKRGPIPTTPSSGKRLHSAHQIKPDSEEAFNKLCQELETDFFGVMRIYGEVGDKSFAAGILLKDGLIIGASTEELSTNTLWYGEEAIECIQNHLVGTKGGLEVYAFNKEDEENILKDNQEPKLENQIPLTTFGLKIRGNLAKWVQQQKAFLSGGKLKFNLLVGPWTTSTAAAIPTSGKGGLQPQENVLNFTEKFKLVNFARSPPKPKSKPKLVTSRPLVVEEKKRNVEEELRLRAPRGGTKKVQTKLDLMLKLIQKKGVVKMPTLVNQLKVPESQIEEWGRILESSGLILVNIPLMGDPEFRKIELVD
ncbi:DUF2226 domain-containing protein [Candidatus Altiarchaeota archaeon]